MLVSDKIAYLRKTCRSTGYVVYKDSDKIIKSSLIPKRCHSWLCDSCQRVLSRSWATSTQKYFEGEKVRFLTLTMDKRVDAKESYKAISKAWNRLSGKIKRKFGKFKFVRVLEIQPSTQKAHYHVLVNVFIEQKWLSDNAEKCGFGKIVDIRIISNQGVFEYVSKYLRKKYTDSPGLQTMVDSKSRRVAGSRGFICLRRSSGGGVLCCRNLAMGEQDKILHSAGVHGAKLGFGCSVTAYDSGGGTMIFHCPESWSYETRERKSEALFQFCEELHFAIID